MSIRPLLAAILLITPLILSSCSTYKKTGGAASPDTAYIADATPALDNFRAADPSLKKFFQTSYGFVLFPKIAKGAAGVGAAHGDGGVVYEQERVVGFSDVTQITLGLQLGGQTYSELIFFQNKSGLDDFKRGNMEFSAQVSAVAASAGAAANADYSNGVAVFTLTRGGLMFEASVGGQKFSYRPR